MNDVIIHHLSDIHVGLDHANPVNLVTHVPTDAKRSIRLRRYFEFLSEQGTTPPHLVVFSGDLVSRGEAEEFEIACDWVRRIAALVARRHSDKRAISRVCIVPGNHDLDWSKSTYAEKINNYRQAFKGLKDRVAVQGVSDTPYLIVPGTEVLVYLLNTCTLGGWIKSNIEAAEQALSKAKVPGRSRAEILRSLRDEKRIDPGYIDLEDLREMKRLLSKERREVFKVAVMHHNLSPVPSDRVERFGAIINAGTVRKYLHDNGFDIVLHGHQHHPYCTYEQITKVREIDEYSQKPNWMSHRYTQGIHIIGAPSLGTSESDAAGPRWFEIVVHGARNAKGEGPPSALVDVFEAKSDEAGSYNISKQPMYRFAVSKGLNAQLGVLHEHLERQRPLPINAEYEAREAIAGLLRSTLRLKGRLDDWPQAGDTTHHDRDWKTSFLAGLEDYRCILGIDMLGPDGWMHASYLEYVHRQFEEKKRRSGRQRGSQDLLTAMERTGWGTIRQRARANSGLQIARILMWKKSEVCDAFGRCVLNMIDLMHRMHDIPVFILDKDEARLAVSERNEEFVFAGMPKSSQCYVYDLSEPNKKTQLVTKDEAKRFLERFNMFLRKPTLRSIPQFLKGDS